MINKLFKTTISDGIAELVFDHPPVSAFDSKGWAAIAAEIEALGVISDLPSCAESIERIARDEEECLSALARRTGSAG